MDNNKALKYRKQLPSLNNFNITELYDLPQYFGWVNYYVDKENKTVEYEWINELIHPE